MKKKLIMLFLLMPLAAQAKMAIPPAPSGRVSVAFADSTTMIRKGVLTIPPAAVAVAVPPKTKSPSGTSGPPQFSMKEFFKEFAARFKEQFVPEPPTADELKAAEEKKLKEQDRFGNSVADKVAKKFTDKGGIGDRMSDSISSSVSSSLDGSLLMFFIGMAFLIALALTGLYFAVRKLISAVPRKTSEEVIDGIIDINADDAFRMKRNGLAFEYKYQHNTGGAYISLHPASSGGVCSYASKGDVNRSLAATLRKLRVNKAGNVDYSAMSDEQVQVIKYAISNGHLTIILSYIEI